MAALTALSLPLSAQVWLRLMNNASFWLTLILLVTIVMAKDIYICGLERNFNFKPQHIIQEVLRPPRCCFCC